MSSLCGLGFANLATEAMVLEHPLDVLGIGTVVRRWKASWTARGTTLRAGVYKVTVKTNRIFAVKGSKIQLGIEPSASGLYKGIQRIIT